MKVQGGKHGTKGLTPVLDTGGREKNKGVKSNNVAEVGRGWCVTVGGGVLERVCPEIWIEGQEGGGGNKEDVVTTRARGTLEGGNPRRLLGGNSRERTIE